MTSLFREANGSLVCCPRHRRLRFLGRERRKDELWEAGLPGESFGFIQCQAQHLIWRLEALFELVQDRLFGAADLSDQLAAGRNAALPQTWVGVENWIDFISRFHICDLV